MLVMQRLNRQPRCREAQGLNATYQVFAGRFRTLGIRSMV